MKTKELMLFDLIRRKKDGKSMTVVELRYAETVAAITPDDVYYGDMEDYHESEIEPIPLTPEILEKNGFKMAKWKEDEPAGLLGKWGDNRGQVLVKRFDFTLLGEVYSVKANNSRISNIRYVHELQHALRLCGIDREITV